MTPTFENVWSQAKTLTSEERVKLAEMLIKTNDSKKSLAEKRREKIRVFRGKYKHILPTTEEFLAEKERELEIEKI